MANIADEHPGETPAVHIDHAATVTARMPIPDEYGHGYPPDAPVLVVADSGYEEVFPPSVALTFSDPHEQLPPDVLQKAALYVLGEIGEELDLIGVRVNDLYNALSRSRCGVVHLAAEVRAERYAESRCTDDGMCERDAAVEAGARAAAVIAEQLEEAYQRGLSMAPETAPQTYPGIAGAFAVIGVTAPSGGALAGLDA